MQGGKEEAEARAKDISLSTGHPLKQGRAHGEKGLHFWEHFPGGLASASKVSDPWTFHLGTSSLTTLAVFTLWERPDMGGECVCVCARVHTPTGAGDRSQGSQSQAPA